ncbi:MAG: hypothetical protein CME59_11570 [Halioglobus sp.]|nr:hypothetical protein [Halioglobus sp.]
MSEALLLQQFAREPVPGRVKTRMQPHLSAQQACELHRELVLWTCTQLVEAALGPVEICVAGDPADALFARCRERGATAVVAQQGADLGARMLHALQRGLRGHRKVLLVGSDCPAISPAYLALASAALECAPVVLGPAHDGGYVLIGVTRVEPGIFTDVSWGGAEVYARTGRNLRALGLDWEALPPLQDIDRPQDLPAWEALRRCAL